MTDWKSIKTAPKDGQLCVVFDPGHTELTVWPAQYSKENNCFFSGSYGCVGWFEYKDVTHWMPLPTPPEEKG